MVSLPQCMANALCDNCHNQQSTTSVMIYHRRASLSEQDTDLLICHCTKQDLSHTSKHVEKSSPEIPRYYIRMPTDATTLITTIVIEICTACGQPAVDDCSKQAVSCHVCFNFSHLNSRLPALHAGNSPSRSPTKCMSSIRLCNIKV